MRKGHLEGDRMGASISPMGKTWMEKKQTSTMDRQCEKAAQNIQK